MPEISELNSYPTDGEQQASLVETSYVETPPKGEPNPRPNETPYYTNEGPVSPEQLCAAIGVRASNLVVVRRAQAYPR